MEFILDCLEYMRERGLAVVEPEQDAQDRWVEHVAEVGNSTLFPRANSWYMGANIPGKVRVFTPYIGGVGTYRERCEEIAAKGYEGFAFAAEAASEAAAAGARS